MNVDRDFTQEDLEQNRTMAALGYIVFFVPLIKCRDSKVGRYCANQGLILLVLMVLVSILFNIFAVIPFIGWLFTLLPLRLQPVHYAPLPLAFANPKLRWCVLAPLHLRRTITRPVSYYALFE